MGAQRVAVEELDPVEAAPLQLLVPFPQLFELVGLGGDIDFTGALELAVDAVAGDRLLDGVEVALPSSSSFLISSGQRSSPLGRPWVREAAQNPPLRPEAAQPVSCPSISTTSRSGSRSLASSAVHSPL